MSETYEFCKAVRMDLLSYMARSLAAATPTRQPNVGWKTTEETVDFGKVYNAITEELGVRLDTMCFNPNNLTEAEMDELGFFYSGSPLGAMYYIPLYLVPFLAIGIQLWYSPRQSFHLQTNPLIGMAESGMPNTHWLECGIFIPNK